ncbi:hypothetical protein EDC22_1086 [Tepidamorphus gemmatus]|uniref:Uncharacterized protein n=1 Tax=Tepidamorphus gemmatus TaxID=747076 RepID=A0A4R3M5Q4_9HYPH|nr:hypothetical protein [Tepidamorphus gemmatus]TCT08694.1 hypothetical protein EDC22_1086 [Tepidamorphus gemmatus]
MTRTALLVALVALLLPAAAAPVSALAIMPVADAPSAVAAPALACGDGVGDNCAPVRLASGNCAAAAAQAAAAQGGQVIGAPLVVQSGGQTLCVVTILVRDPSGQRPPERRQITIPAR